MKNDEEYGEHANPRLYSYFEEVFKRPNIRDWLQWNDADKGFSNRAHLREFYGWMLGEPNDDDEFGEPKLPEAKSVRDLGVIIENDSAMAVFRSENGSLTKALAKYEAEHPEDWKPIVSQAQTVLASLSPDALRALSDNDTITLNGLKERISLVLEDRRRLLGDSNARPQA